MGPNIGTDSPIQFGRPTVNREAPKDTAFEFWKVRRQTPKTCVGLRKAYGSLNPCYQKVSCYVVRKTAKKDVVFFSPGLKPSIMIYGTSVSVSQLSLVPTAENQTPKQPGTGESQPMAWLRLEVCWFFCKFSCLLSISLLQNNTEYKLWIIMIIMDNYGSFSLFHQKSSVVFLVYLFRHRAEPPPKLVSSRLETTGWTEATSGWECVVLLPTRVLSVSDLILVTYWQWSR